MNRAARIRRVIPGADDELVMALARRPAAEVDLIVAGLRQARRDAVDHEKARRRQQRADARAHHWYDEDALAARNTRILSAAGQRAAADLAALVNLDRFIRHAQDLRQLAVAGLHARGYPDEEIAQALGMTRMGAWKLRNRKLGFLAIEEDAG